MTKRSPTNVWSIDLDSQGNYFMKYSKDIGATGKYFDDQEACAEELNKLINKKINAGKCPRCYYKQMYETSLDISSLPELASLKFGTLYQCNHCLTHWFANFEGKVSYAYEPTQIEFIYEWNKLDLRLSDSFKKSIKEIPEFEVSDGETLIPVYAVFADGTESAYSLISLSNRPPSASWFSSRETWYYINQVKDLRPSPAAYPSEIIQQISSRVKNGNPEVIYIRENASGKIYGIHPYMGIFMDALLEGKSLTLLKDPSEEEKMNVRFLFDLDDRSGRNRKKVIYIWGDNDDKN